jgi:hypothetical protein
MGSQPAVAGPLAARYDAAGLKGGIGMGRWLRLPFVWAWRVATLRRLTPRARLAVCVVLLYFAAAALVWYSLPPWPRAVTPMDEENVPLGFTGDGRTLATLDGEACSYFAPKSVSVRLWDTATGQLQSVHRLPYYRGEITSRHLPAPFIQFGPDGRALATLAIMPRGSTSRARTFQNTVTVWDLATDHPRFAVCPDDLGEGIPVVIGMAFSPDGRWLGVVVSHHHVHSSSGRTRQETICVYDAFTGAPRASLPGYAGYWYNGTGPLEFGPHMYCGVVPARVRFSPDGAWLAVDTIRPGQEPRDTVIYDIEARREVIRFTDAHDGAFATNGRSYWAHGEWFRSDDYPLMPVTSFGLGPDAVTRYFGPAALFGFPLDTIFLADRGLMVSLSVVHDVQRDAGWFQRALQWWRGSAPWTSAVRDETYVTMTEVPAGRQWQVSFPGWIERIACDDHTLAVATKDKRLEFWDVPPRPPRGVIFAGAAVPPILVLLGTLAWRAMRRGSRP